MLNHRRKFAALFLLFFLFSFSVQSYAFLPLAFNVARTALARFVPSSAVVSVATSGAKQLEILSTRFAAKYPQGAGSSVLVMRRIGASVAGSFLAAFLLDAGYNALTSTGSFRVIASNGSGVIQSSIPSFAAAQQVGAQYCLDNAGVGANYLFAYGNVTCNVSQFSSSIQDTGVVTTTSSGDSLDPFIVEFESLPDKASKDAWAIDKVNKLKTFAASNPNIPFDDSVALLEGGTVNGIGYSLDSNGKGHVYTSDPNGNLSVDGVAVAESQSPSFSNTATYTDSNGITHTLSYDGSGNLLDNGVPVSFGSTSSTVNSQVIDSTTGNTTTTTTITNPDGTSVVKKTVTSPTGTVISTSNGGTSNQNPVDFKALANEKASGIATALGDKMAVFRGDSGGTRPMMQFHIDGKLAHETDMSSEFNSLGVGSMMSAMMGTFGMLISLIFVGRAVTS